MTFFLVSCASIGPSRINADRMPWNDAISNTESEQLLRNIVRLRYLESVSFLTISSVTSSYTLNPSLSSSLSLSGTASQGQSSETSRGLSLNPSVSYSDSPTISYMPVASTDFIQQMLMPIRLDRLALLLNGGIHDPNLIFNLATVSMNDIDNAERASDLKILTPPDYKEFKRLTCLINRLIAKKGASFQAVKIGGDDLLTLSLHFTREYNYSCEAREIKRMLHVPVRYQDIIFVQREAAVVKLPNVVKIHTRSILGVLIFLSHGVEVPEEHIKSKRALRYHAEPHVPYDWSPLMNGIIRICSSKSEPHHAFVKVFSHDYWFYIDWSDFDSITTFNFINTLIILSSGNALNGSGQIPVLTIPTR